MPPNVTVTSPVVQAAQTAQAAQSVSYDQYKGLDEAKEQRKNESIHRQTAAKVAGQLASVAETTAEDFWRNMQHLTHYFKTGESPFDRQPVTPSPQQQQTMDTFAPTEYVHSNDDIPF